MGHERVGVLPRSKTWKKVVELLAQSPDSETGIAEVANATLSNVNARFKRIHKDEGLKAAVRFLISLSTSSAKDFSREDPSFPSLSLESNPSLLRISADLQLWVDCHKQSLEYGELAKKAATDAIMLWADQQTKQKPLFTNDSSAIELWKKANSGAGFCEISRLFFSKFTERYLTYFLAREASRVLSNLQDRQDFSYRLREHVDDISRHAFETSKITQSFAAGWFNKNARDTAPNDFEVEKFLRISFGKIHDELMREGVQVE